MSPKLFGRSSTDPYDSAISNQEPAIDRQSRPGRKAARQARRVTAAVGARNPGSDGHVARAIFHDQDHLECTVTEVMYMGDEGGVMCHLTFDEEDATEVFLTSITHLAFDRRLPVAREIAAYQKHRIKRLRRGGSTVAPATHS